MSYKKCNKIFMLKLPKVYLEKLNMFDMLLRKLGNTQQLHVLQAVTLDQRRFYEKIWEKKPNVYHEY